MAGRIAASGGSTTYAPRIMSLAGAGGRDSCSMPYVLAAAKVFSKKWSTCISAVRVCFELLNTGQMVGNH